MPELVNVPDVDGVPDVLFAGGIGAGIVAATSDAASILPVTGATQWGIFRQGQPVVTCESVVAFDHKADWAISDYPVEGGQFESYNKVVVPYDCRFVFTSGGSEQARVALLGSLEAIVGDLNFYDAVSPEKVYTPVNLVHLSYRRAAQNGVKLLQVSVFARQVRQASSSTAGAAGGADATGTDTPSATGNVGDTASPSGADQVNGGTVQATDATSAQTAGVGPQDFAGGYNVGGFDATTGGTLGNGNFGTGIEATSSTVETSVGDGTVVDPTTGEVLIQGGVPAADTPATTSSISGSPPAGGDFSAGVLGGVS